MPTARRCISSTRSRTSPSAGASSASSSTWLRESDTLARLGGDEFAVLLPHADVGEAELGNRTDQLVIEAVVRIARGLGKETIAEFVSDPQLEAFVRSQGVDHAQGFYVGRPVALAQIGLGSSAPVS